MKILTRHLITFQKSGKSNWHEFVFEGYTEFPSLPTGKMIFELNYSKDQPWDIFGSVEEVEFKQDASGAVEYHASLHLDKQLLETFDDFSKLFLGSDGLISHFCTKRGHTMESSPLEEMPEDLAEATSQMTREWFDSL